MSIPIAWSVSRTCWSLPRVPATILFTRAGSASVRNGFRGLYARTQTTSSLKVDDDNIIDSLSGPPEPLKDKLPTDQKPLSSLKGVISYDTLKAMTVNPYKFTHLTSVQSAVFDLLPQLVEPADPSFAQDSSLPRDLLVKAKTGTGKTAAFVVPAIEHRIKSIEATRTRAIKEGDKHAAGLIVRNFTRQCVGALIISPTRELAEQIAQETQRLSHHHKEIEVKLFIGGASRGGQLRDFSRGTRDIVVGTPGRLRDVLTSEPNVANSLSKVPLLILDEADTLLDMGFQEEIKAISEFLPSTPERQTFMFSATVSKEIRGIAGQLLDKNHKFINCATEDSPVHARVAQYHTVLPDASDQIPHILRLIAHDQLSNPRLSKVVVFLPTTKQTELFSQIFKRLSKALLPAGQSVTLYEMHSRRTQGARTATSDAFRKKMSGAPILITSDVSARGVDYPGVTRVIQVGIPPSHDIYVHRVGRTGRAGSMGRGDLILLPWEVNFLNSELRDIPLKPVTTEEVKTQLEALASTFDADPNAYLQNIAPEVSSPRRSNKTASDFSVLSGSLTPLIEKIDKSVESVNELMVDFDVPSVLGSMLGYYVGRIRQLRIGSDDLLDHCKEWCVKGLGLPTAPNVSSALLSKLGIGKGQRSSFGHRSKSSFDDTPRSYTKSSFDGTPRSYPRSSFDGTPRSSFDGTPRSYPRSSFDSTPRSSFDSTPRSSFDSTPRSSFDSTPRSYPRSSFDGTQRSSPRPSYGSKYSDNSRSSYNDDEFIQRSSPRSSYGSKYSDNSRPSYDNEFKPNGGKKKVNYNVRGKWNKNGKKPR